MLGDSIHQYAYFLAIGLLSVLILSQSFSVGRSRLVLRKNRVRPGHSNSGPLLVIFLINVGFALLIIIGSRLSAVRDTSGLGLLYPGLFGISSYLLYWVCPKINARTSLFVAAQTILLILLYSLFVWSGFGRIMIAAYCLIPLLVLHHYGHLNFRPWAAFVAAPLGIVLSSVLRWSVQDRQGGGFLPELKRELISGSVGAHLDLTAKMFELRDTKLGAYLFSTNFVEQYSLLFLQWVPRVAWPSKPIGIGLVFVDDFLNRQATSAEYSVSLGFIGEHLYFSGDLWPFTLAVTLGSLLGIRRTLMALSKSAFFVILFDVSLISYVWGGMAAFGSRFWLIFIPVLVFSWLWNTLLTAGKAELSPRRLPLGPL